MRRVEAGHALAVAGVLAVLYAASAPRTVALEDDAFFILAAHFSGVAHPPGYPLHSLLGKLFTWLPFGSVAWRMHLLSAVLGAASCAALWLCARALGLARPAAWVAALCFGVSPAFWSQSIIAEVYTLNTLFLFALLYCALTERPLPWIAFLFGLSLSNHWPLMLLAAPALAMLLWPRRAEVARRIPFLGVLLLFGLAPYAWMVWRSGYSPIAFYGPIESLYELWFYVSRQGYAQTDVSATAGFMDRAQFFAFFGRELLLQFAVAGTLLAAWGCALQWREWGHRVAAALTFGFLATSVLLLVLLGFDYDALQKQVFRVYPLPAYGIAALWLGLGFTALARRQAWGRGPLAAVGAALVALVFAVSSQWNLRQGYDWTARYAAAVLDTLPRDASLVLSGDSDTGPLTYFHLVEGRRPDLTLYHAQGLILGNRLFHPLHTRSEEAMRTQLRSLAGGASGPIAFVNTPPEGFAHRHRGLYVLVERGADGVTPDLSPPIRRFVDESLLGRRESDPWTRLVQEKLRERVGAVTAVGMEPGRRPEPDTARMLEGIAADAAGALGIAEGLLANRAGHSVRQVAHYLDKARETLPADAPKDRRARFFELRAYVRLGQGDARGALADLETAMQIWPSDKNRARRALEDLRRTVR